MDRWNYGIDENSKLKNALINQLIQGLFVRENSSIASRALNCFIASKKKSFLDLIILILCMYILVNCTDAVVFFRSCEKGGIENYVKNYVNSK